MNRASIATAVLCLLGCTNQVEQTGSEGVGGASGTGGMGIGGVAGSGGMAGTTGMGGSGAMAGSGGMPGTGGTMVPDAPYCEPTQDWPAEWATLEDRVLVLVNQHRAAGASCDGQAQPPVSPLTMDPSLRCAARMHSRDMVERGFFSHDSPDGEGPGERLAQAGYMGRGAGENIAGGNATAEETIQQWMDSGGHCRNIMGESYTLIGVGYYPGGDYRHYWTQTFAN